MEQVKKCNICAIILTDDNKIKNKNRCKLCQRKKNSEHYEKKIKPVIAANSEIKKQEKEIIIKKCTQCSITLTDDNKIKGRNSCKSCYSKKNKEYYEKNIQPDIIIKNENKMVDIKKCNECSVILTPENKVKDRNSCKDCRTKKYKEYTKTKLTEKYNETLDVNAKTSSVQTTTDFKKCSKCEVILTLENCVKNRPICKICYNAKCKEYKIKNKEKVSENSKQYYEANKEKIAEYYKEHYIENKDTYMENNKQWREENRETINQKANERLKIDPVYKLKRHYRHKVYNALKGIGEKNINKITDCSIDFLKEWLEYNFTDDMSMDNYGEIWQVDHVIPCARFNLNNEEEIKHCFRWTNVQPLLRNHNSSKQSKVNETEIIEHFNKVKKFAALHNITLEEFNYSKYISI